MSQPTRSMYVIPGWDTHVRRDADLADKVVRVLEVFGLSDVEVIDPASVSDFRSWRSSSPGDPKYLFAVTRAEIEPPRVHVEGLLEVMLNAPVNVRARRPDGCLEPHPHPLAATRRR